jgi:hypothetical protein
MSETPRITPEAASICPAAAAKVMVGAAILKAAPVKLFRSFDAFGAAAPVCGHAHDLFRNLIPHRENRDLYGLGADRWPEQHAHVVHAALQLLRDSVARIPAGREDVGPAVLGLD